MDDKDIQVISRNKYEQTKQRQVHSIFVINIKIIKYDRKLSDLIAEITWQSNKVDQHTCLATQTSKSNCHFRGKQMASILKLAYTRLFGSNNIAAFPGTEIIKLLETFSTTHTSSQTAVTDTVQPKHITRRLIGSIQNCCAYNRRQPPNKGKLISKLQLLAIFNRI